MPATSFSSHTTNPPLSGMLELDYMVRWWDRLEQESPTVAAKLVEMFPERYPIRVREVV